MTDSKKAGSSMGKIGDKIPVKQMRPDPKESSETEDEAIIKTDAQFILMNRAGFRAWLNGQDITRTIKLIQNHHTYKPDYSNFNGDDHFDDLKAMDRYHEKKKGWSDIGQNLTVFPDGMIGVCRPLNIAPAGIKGANRYGICIENYGNFDIGGDEMKDRQRKSILWLNALLCKKFNLTPNTNTIVYHHWWNWSGKRTNGADGKGKSCPGTNFFGGNKVEDAQINFIPKIINELRRL